jgi:hypothetical protein
MEMHKGDQKQKGKDYQEESKEGKEDYCSYQED